MFRQLVTLKQWFSIPVLGTPCSAHFACLPYLTHLTEIISSLVQFMSLSPNKLMSSIRCVKKRRHAKCAGQGVPRTGIEKHCLKETIYVPQRCSWELSDAHCSNVLDMCVFVSPSVMFWSTCESLWEWDCVAGIWRIPLSPGYQESWVCRVSGSAFALIAVTTGEGAFGNWSTWERKCRVGVGYETGHLLLVLKVRHWFIITEVQRLSSQTYILCIYF